ncbi:MAG: P1 family peptidase [Gemmatimonadetes bacterium]|nr:P1 family peptidase [Gemmatimonadota bacterium]
MVAHQSPAITDVEDLLVGHATDVAAWTGCTVLLGPAEGMRAAGYIRGRATGTRELDALSPSHLVPQIHAILLAGGSAFGLGAADGVMRWLAERGRGFSVGVGVVPIVPTAVVFDLAPLGRADRWPTATDAYAACEAAGREVAEGSVGAGAGATVGKALGLAGAMKGGLGTWSVRQGEVVVGALAVVNAFGDVRDAKGGILAGARGPDGFLDARRHLAEGKMPGGSFARAGANTTLVVVGTNADLPRGALAEVSRMTADALGQRITPVGTQFDGDIIFAVSTAQVEVESSLPIEILAQDATAMAIERAVRLARGTKEVPGLAD